MTPAIALILILVALVIAVVVVIRRDVKKAADSEARHQEKLKLYKAVFQVLTDLGPAGGRAVPERVFVGDAEFDMLLGCLWAYHEAAAKAETPEALELAVNQAKRMESAIRGIAILRVLPT